MTDVVAKDQVVFLDYRLTNSAGEELDASTAEDPLFYLHGHHNIVEGLEEALAGKKIGDRVEVVVPPEKGYGVLEKTKPIKLAKSKFPPNAHIEKGVRFIFEDQNKQPFAVWVTKVMGAEVHLTTNHPLAGVELHFDCTVKRIRAANEDELAHGHPHGPEGDAGHHH